jgi:hypothetical protein
MKTFLYIAALLLVNIPNATAGTPAETAMKSLADLGTSPSCNDLLFLVKGGTIEMDVTSEGEGAPKFINISKNNFSKACKAHLLPLFNTGLLTAAPFCKTTPNAHICTVVTAGSLPRVLKFIKTTPPTLFRIEWQRIKAPPADEDDDELPM